LPAAVLALALFAAACGTGTPSTDAVALVQPPALPFQGCTYVLNGTVPAGEPSGIQPGFPVFSPDQAAQSAVQDIATHGGTGIVDGFSLPTGTALYTGPDAGRSPVATLSGGRTILTAGPVLWTTRSGVEWLAFFVACGGNFLYWVRVDQVPGATAGAGGSLAQSIAAVKAAPPYTQTGQASTLSIRIEKRHIEWDVPSSAHPLTAPARGLYLPY
jgi:hypothetical protein